MKRQNFVRLDKVYISSETQRDAKVLKTDGYIFFIIKDQTIHKHTVKCKISLDALLFPRTPQRPSMQPPSSFSMYLHI